MKFTKLTLVLLLLILTTGVSQSQNMIVTLGTSGTFKINDATNNYLTLYQSSGQVRILRSLGLEYTGNSSTTGVIFKGVNRFIHDFRPSGANGQNTFMGVFSGSFSMSGTGVQASYNTGVGYASLNKLTTGSDNTAVGNFSLYNNTTGSDNTAVGNFSLRNNTGTNNTALGSWSLNTNTTGDNNTAVGNYSLHTNISGNYNTAVGNYSLRTNTSGDYNTVVGHYAGNLITTGSNVTCLGFDAKPTSGSVSNQITLGNWDVTSLRCNVTTITALSDARDKKNIKDLSLGLDFLMNVKPRLFNWDRREWYDDNISDGSKIQETPTAGFIAQELDEVQKTQNAEWLNLVLKDNPERLESTPGNLLPIMVKAIQELKIENDELKEKLSKYEQLQNLLVIEIEKLKSKEGEILKTSSK